MIEEDYVSFETAKLLKEKGFDEQTRDFYRFENNIWIHRNTYEHNHFNLGMPRWENCYSCPTLQMAMKWLRKVHNIDIIPFHEKLPNDCYWCRIEKYPYTEYNQELIYKKYEESLNAAIKYCLENLI